MNSHVYASLITVRTSGLISLVMVRTSRLVSLIVVRTSGLVWERASSFNHVIRLPRNTLHSFPSSACHQIVAGSLKEVFLTTQSALTPLALQRETRK